MNSHDELESLIQSYKNISDSLQKCLEPIVTQTFNLSPMVQIVQQLQDVFPNAARLDSIDLVNASFNKMYQAVWEQYQPAISIMDSLRTVSNSFSAAITDMPQISSLSNALKSIAESGVPESIGGIETTLNELSSYIEEITCRNNAVYIPEQLIPEDYFLSKEPDTVKTETQSTLSIHEKKKKLSLYDAYNIIYGLIILLLTVAGFLQSQMSPSSDQVQELIEEQAESNELLKKNNELLQQQIDASLQSADYLSLILSEIQAIAGEHPEENPKNAAYAVNADSDSQLIDSDLPEQLLKNQISSDEPDTPDKH